jgi:ferredoxin
MDQFVVGTDPYLIDLVCAHMARFDYQKVRTLELAEKKGILTQAHFRFADSLDLPEDRKKFDLPEAGPIAAFIHSPKRQKFFLKIRNTAFFTYLASTDWFGKLLFLTNLRQDVFLSEEMACEGLKIDKDLCDNCGVCKAVCPVGLDSPKDDGCIECLYCYSVCPNHAIQFKGDPGFFGEQLKQYDRVIRNLYKNNPTKGG